jgi:hypothetical protein
MIWQKDGLLLHLPTNVGVLWIKVKEGVAGWSIVSKGLWTTGSSDSHIPAQARERTARSHARHETELRLLRPRTKVGFDFVLSRLEARLFCDTMPTRPQPG